jgi:sterol desaturase/sphingolipid hydroxylase (fatty acid hydroxylase superfamily)
MLALPLSMTLEWSPLHYTNIFKEEWYHFDSDSDAMPSPLGLSLGLLAVAVGQLCVLIVFYLFKYGFLGGPPRSVQTKGARPYQFWEGLTTHLAQPEGFFLLGAYLSGTWMFRIMPDSYYSFENGIEWHKVFMCLVLQDGIQYAMHRLEHDVSPAFYQWSHKPHHRFTNPRLFDAFNGSVLDTICMILIPLICTAQIMNTVNVWTYMAFGSSYANWLTLIHSEYAFPWDHPLFHALGFGTPADHHVHHAFFKYNFGHLFMWFDKMAGTYKSPSAFAPKAFNKNV